MPFFSIIIPVFNKGKYLDKCLQSIATQSFKDWEVILVNDGSTDESPSICEAWQKADSRVNVVHQKNSGAAAARNKGISLATGKYIQFTDADDWWGLEAFSKLAKELCFFNYPEILIFGITKVNKNNFSRTITPRKYGKISKQVFFEHLIPEQSESGIYGCVANKVISRKLVTKAHLRFNPMYKLMEDYDFFLSTYACCEHLAQSKLADYFYLQNTEHSSTSPDFHFDRLDIIKVLIKSYELTLSFIPTPRKTYCDIISKQLSGQYICTFLEISDISKENLSKIDKKYKKALDNIPKVNLSGWSFTTNIIALFLKNACYSFLSYLLRLKRTLQ